ncbi:MAG: hypothetical protein IKL53_03280 [Lachnospiraceae bacterium]|nr:hypothetical protein [Lachnospiraceae bacterium]
MKQINFIFNPQIVAHKGHFPNWDSIDISVSELSDTPIYNTLEKLALGATVLSFDMFDHDDHIGYILIEWDGVTVNKWQGSIYPDHFTRDLAGML